MIQIFEVQSTLGFRLFLNTFQIEHNPLSHSNRMKANSCNWVNMTKTLLVKYMLNMYSFLYVSHVSIKWFKKEK